MKPNNFAIELKQWRVAHHLSQKKAAPVLEMGKRTLEMYEKGRGNYDPVKIARIRHLMNTYVSTHDTEITYIESNPKYLYIGQRIKQLRERLTLTQVDFAKSIGLTQGAISQIELGGTISEETLMKICKRYNVTMTDLLPPEPKPEPLQASDPSAEFKLLLNENKMLKELLKAKDETIEALKQRKG